MGSGVAVRESVLGVRATPRRDRALDRTFRGDGTVFRRERAGGFAQIVTDSSTFGWLCDVFVDAAHEGHGLGSFLVATTTSHPSIRGIRLLLSATPGRTLYARHGFTPLDSPDRWMALGSMAPRDRDSTEAGR
jgi:GNAT superfamily N-acetyltransferase